MKKLGKFLLCVCIFLLVLLWFVHVAWILFDHGSEPGPLDAPTVLQNNEQIRRYQSGERSSVVVLLQQSQVQTAKQIERLRNIDQGWARWASSRQLCSRDVHIVAAMQEKDISTNQFESIGIHTMFPVVWISPFNSSHKTITSSPYHQLVRSLFAILSSSGQLLPLKWLVLANDHTFMIPQNLAQRLSTLDTEQLVYTGNQLALPFRKEVLSFASGGAGAVLSHATAKLILGIWMLITEEDILLSLLTQYAPSHSVVPAENDATVQWGNRNSTSESIAAGTATCMQRIVCTPRKGDATTNLLVIDLSRSAASKVGCALYAIRQWLYFSTPQQAFDGPLCDASALPPSTQVRLTLSSKIHITIARPEKHLPGVAGSGPRIGRGEFNMTVATHNAVGSESAVEKTATADQLRRHCSAPDKWSKTNPGIILINCLSRLFNVEFTPSLSRNVITHPEIAPTGDVRPAELFNVYGALRTLFGEYDDWYVEAKRLIASTAGVSGVQYDGKMQLAPPALARDVISFHYVSTYESQLLYRILDAQLRASLAETHPVSSAEATEASEGGALPALCTGSGGAALAPLDAKLLKGAANDNSALKCTSAQDLLNMWPRSEELVGHYSRPLARGLAGQKQAAVLHAYLSQIRIGQL